MYVLERVKSDNGFDSYYRDSTASHVMKCAFYVTADILDRGHVIASMSVRAGYINFDPITNLDFDYIEKDFVYSVAVSYKSEGRNYEDRYSVRITSISRLK